MTRAWLLLPVLLLIASLLPAQQTTVYTDAYRAFKRAETFYGQGLFAKAQTEYEAAIHLLQPVNEPDAELLRTRAELGHAKTAVQLEQPDGEKLILDFVRRHSPDPVANQALIEIANFYFNDGQYDKAVSYYQRVPSFGLSREERAEVNFRIGYSYFVQKDFARAKTYFRDIKDIENDYYYPTNYYLGLVHFFEGDYDTAVRQFRIVERSNTYDDYIPYYLAQIYFAQRRFDELLAYAEPRLADSRLRNEREIRQLVGQAYFEKGDFQRALPFLEAYAERSGSLRAEEWYQLGYAQYKTGKYEPAIRSFKEVSGINSQMGQAANYYLADAYLRNRDLVSARSAFGNAMRMSFDPVITEESAWNYGKLSYELRDPREAITALQALQPVSRYYLDAQRLMGDIFLSYRDYQQALSVLDRIPNKTPELQEALQKVTFLRGLQLMQEDKLDDAQAMFQRSLSTPLDISTRAQATYWLADIAHRREQYAESTTLLSQFLTLSRTVSNLPPESSDTLPTTCRAITI